jgi:ABC-2 type transport system permease protein
MLTLYILFRHELRRLLLSPSIYAVGTLFLVFMGALYFLLLAEFSEMQQDHPAASAFFSIFWLPTLVTIPLLTMRTLAEERRQGTLEALFVTPARPLMVTCAKFLSTYVLYMSLWGLTLTFPFLVSLKYGLIVAQSGIVDTPSLIGGYTFIAVSGFMYIALGIFSSSLTKSQLAAGMLCFAMLFTLVVGGKALVALPLLETLGLGHISHMLSALDPFQHLTDFCRGVIDTRPCILYPTFGLLSLGLTSLTLESKA